MTEHGVLDQSAASAHVASHEAVIGMNWITEGWMRYGEHHRQRSDPECTMTNRPEPDLPNLANLAQDWVTLWQSELTALARDREAQEHWAMLIGFWAGMAGQITIASATPARNRDGRSARPAGTNDAARPAPAPAASDPGGEPGADQLTIAGLHQRIADLEARLAALDRDHPSRRD
jgi:hypothetical protein